MHIIQLLDRLLKLLALADLGLGLWLWISGHDVTLPIGKLWYQLDVASLNFFQVIVQRYIFSSIWDAIIVPMLLRPTWEILLFVFLFLLVLRYTLITLARRGHRS